MGDFLGCLIGVGLAIGLGFVMGASFGSFTVESAACKSLGMSRLDVRDAVRCTDGKIIVPMFAESK